MLAPACAIWTSCQNLTDGYSTDPVEITDPSVIATTKFLSGAQTNLIGVYEGDINRLTGMWVGHFSGEDRQYIPLSNYAVSGRDFNTEWGGIYAGVLANTRIVKSRSQQAKSYQTLGIAQVMEAMAVGLAADLWGDVPYSEAIQYPVIKTPKYDTQASVYAAMQAILDSAIVNLATPVPAALRPGKEDVFYAGDVSAWTAAAHTLKARFYLHTKDYAKALTESQQGIADASGTMYGTHGSTYLQTFNLFYSFTTYDRPGYMGANSLAPRLLDATAAESRDNDKTREEARLWYYYLVGGGGNFTSIAYEPNVLVDFDWGTNPTVNGFFGATTSFPMISYEENLLIKAEANAKSGQPDDALTALNELRGYFQTGANLSPGYLDTDFAKDWGLTDDNDNPITLAHQYDAYDITDFDDGGIAGMTGKTREEALLYEILEERYVTFVGQLEAYNDVRRTKNLLDVPVKTGNTVIPQRLLYPQSELNTNLANVPTSAVGLTDPTSANTTAY